MPRGRPTAIVFTGPTLAARDVQAVLEGECRPPAAQGDVYRAALAGPRAIGIVDGYFECVPSVWHKEILWALTRGIRVYGSASMGALRAVECAPFGMVGVGEVFAAYRDGRLQDDDEVAVTHGPPDMGYRALSEAMVNMRWTLAAAEAAGVVSRAARAAVECAAKALHYPERVWPRVLDRAAEAGVGRADLDALRRWLPAGRVDRKRADALAMLRAMRDVLSGDLTPFRADFALARSVHWERARRAARPLRARHPDTPRRDGGRR